MADGATHWWRQQKQKKIEKDGGRKERDQSMMG
jgi:hypothetical protein